MFLIVTGGSHQRYDQFWTPSLDCFNVIRVMNIIDLYDQLSSFTPHCGRSMYALRTLIHCQVALNFEQWQYKISIFLVSDTGIINHVVLRQVVICMQVMRLK